MSQLRVPLQCLWVCWFANGSQNLVIFYPFHIWTNSPSNLDSFSIPLPTASSAKNLRKPENASRFVVLVHRLSASIALSSTPPTGNPYAVEYVKVPCFGRFLRLKGLLSRYFQKKTEGKVKAWWWWNPMSNLNTFRKTTTTKINKCITRWCRKPILINKSTPTIKLDLRQCPWTPANSCISTHNNTSTIPATKNSNPSTIPWNGKATVSPSKMNRKYWISKTPNTPQNSAGNSPTTGGNQWSRFPKRSTKPWRKKVWWDDHIRQSTWGMIYDSWNTDHYIC